MPTIDLNNIPVAIAQLVIIVGSIFLATKRNSSKIQQLLIDVAVIKSLIEKSEKDHDTIIELKGRIRNCESGINNAFDKIRSCEK